MPSAALVHLLCLLYTIFITTSIASFRISLSPPRKEVSVQLGEAFLITCEAFDCPEPSFNWVNLLDKTLSGTVSSVGNKSTLSMTKVSKESEGNYLCKVFCNSQTLERNIQVNVYSFPADPVLEISSISLGVQSHISCTVPTIFPAEMLTVQILKNRKVVADSDDTESHMTADDVYELKNISLMYNWTPELGDEGAKVECKAQMSFLDNTNPITRSTMETLSLKYPPTDPRINVFPSDIIRAGDHLSLSCMAESQPPATIRWVKRSEDTETEISSEEYGSLTFYSATPQISGTYICYAENEVGKKSAQVEITVQGLPGKPQISIMPATTVLEGSLVVIECSVEGDRDTNVTLWKVTELEETLILHTDGSVLIEEVEPFHAALYKCKAVNQYGEKEATKSLTVQYAPKNTVISASPPEVNEGVTLTLSCDSDGVPPPKIALYRVLASGESFLLSEEPEVTLTNVQGMNSGVYECVANNSLGNKNSSVTVLVKAPPKNTRLTITPSMTVREGDPVAILCTSEASPSPELVLKKRTEMGMIELETSGERHIISHARLEHAGSYICESRNIVGQQTAETTLTVQAPPKNTRLSITSSMTVREGDPVIILCTSEASPSPELVLKKKTEAGLMELETSGGEYVISHARLEHAGTYICESRNIVGQQTAETTLTVQVPPKNTTVTVIPSENVMEGETIIITCETHSIPSPTILLKKVCSGNSTVMYAKNGTFILHNVTRKDTGTYTINIINEARNETEVIEINVQERQQSLKFNYIIPVIVTSLAAVSAGIIGMVVYHMKQSRLQGSYSLVKALKGKV
ncbi:vascular cell adhesion protein 1 [Rhinophrynus dorsalis]